MKATRKIVFLAVLVSIAIIFSFIDKYMSSFLFPMLPGAKIGLANIVILLVIMNFDLKDGLIVTGLKSVIVGLIFSGLTAFFIGGAASLVSFFVMFGLAKLATHHMSYIGISLIGSFCHSITQLFMIMILYSIGFEVFIYGIYLLLLSIFSGLLIGILSIKLNKPLSNLIGTYNN
ncbi:MAG: Gx transporter family protein [Bacilli bacterium]